MFLPDEPSDGAQWSMRQVLHEGLARRLDAYEAALGKRKARFIVNLHQNHSFVRRFSELCPSLLTRTSTLWDMKLNRLMLPIEHLVVMGLPIFDEGREDNDRFSVELLALDGTLSSAEIKHFAGNGMHHAAVGLVLAFLLCMAVPVHGDQLVSVGRQQENSQPRKRLRVKSPEFKLHSAQ